MVTVYTSQQNQLVNYGCFPSYKIFYIFTLLCTHLMFFLQHVDQITINFISQMIKQSTLFSPRQHPSKSSVLLSNGDEDSKLKFFIHKFVEIALLSSSIQCWEFQCHPYLFHSFVTCNFSFWKLLEESLYLLCSEIS